MEATSQYLNMRRCELSEIDETGGASMEQVDELNHLADKVHELLGKFLYSAYKPGAVLFGIDVLQDLISDLRGTARDIAERERNER